MRCFPFCLIVIVLPIVEGSRAGILGRSCDASRQYVCFGRWVVSHQNTLQRGCQYPELSTITLPMLVSSSNALPTPASFDVSPLVLAMDRIKRQIRTAIVDRRSVLLSRLLNARYVSSSLKQKETVHDTAAEIHSQTTKIAASLKGIAKPLVPEETWEQLTGTEFQEHPECIDELASMGEQVARFDGTDDWIEWNVFGSLHSSLESGHINIWTGRAKQEGYGSKIPLIKTRSIIPLSVDEMVDLLMDSSRVRTYNQWSLGRKDCWISECDPNGHTKIVKNRSQPPLGAKPVVAITLLHARPLQNALGAWLVVSRAVGGRIFSDPDDESAGKCYVLLGVNLLEPHNIDSCLLTAVTHVYSSSVPIVLAERLGVKSAVNFVKDIRAVKTAAR